MKKTALTLIFAIITSLFLSACSGPATPVDTGDKDSVVIAIATEPDTLDPTRGWGHGNSPILQSTLIRYNSSMELEGDLAVEWSISDDGLSYTFSLRQDAYFTDGEKLDAGDVAFTINKCISDLISADLAYADRAEAVDEHTVRVVLREPVSFFLNTLASIGIVPEHAYDETSYGDAPLVSSGPYRFVEWHRQEQLILEANENYYGNAPAIKKVTIVFMDEDAALAAVRAGQVDAACSAATLAGSHIEGYRVLSLPSTDNRGLTLPMSPDTGALSPGGFPMGNNVTGHKELRQAIAYGIDRQLIAEAVLSGYGRPAYSENDGMPWNNPDCAIVTDIAHAKALLSAGGWADTDGDGIVEKDGVSAEFTALYPAGDSVRQAVGLAVAQQILPLGIKMNVEGVSWDELARRMFSDAVIMGWGSSNPSESYYLYRSAGALLDDFYNPEGYTNPVTDGYMTAAMQTTSTEEAYEYWQLAQWDGETGTSMKGECPWVWIVNLDHIYFVRDGLSIGEQPIHPHGHSIPLIQNLQNWSWEE